MRETEERDWRICSLRDGCDGGDMVEGMAEWIVPAFV